MTYLDIDRAIVDITRHICGECKARLDAVPKTNTTERKALQLEYGIDTFCGNAGLLFNTGWDRAKVYDVRRNFWEHALGKHETLRALDLTLDDEEKRCLCAALQAELFLRDSWLAEQYADLAAAKDAGDAAGIFELTVKIGAAEAMFAAWETWRRENNIYPNIIETVLH